VKQLTIRGVTEELHHKIKFKADQQNLSINRYVLTILKESVGFAEQGIALDAEYNDLDYLAGTWTQEDYHDFKDLIDEQREIDPDLWQ